MYVPLQKVEFLSISFSPGVLQPSSYIPCWQHFPTCVSRECNPHTSPPCVCIINRKIQQDSWQAWFLVFLLLLNLFLFREISSPSKLPTFPASRTPYPTLFRDTEINQSCCTSLPYLIYCFWGFVFKQNTRIAWHGLFLAKLSCIFCFPLNKMFFSTVISSEPHAEAISVMGNLLGLLWQRHLFFRHHNSFSLVAIQITLQYQTWLNNQGLLSWVA